MEQRRPKGHAIEPEARDAVRNASLLVAQRGLDALGAVAFVALVPRLLGPADFGRFALLIATAHWFSFLSGLGSTQLMGRFVPVMVLQEERAAARRLFGNLLALRLLSGSGAAAVYLLLMFLWLRDLPLALLAPIAASVVLRSASTVLFAFFLGLNQAARWGAGELARRWSSLVLVLAGTLTYGVYGACLGAALAEVYVLALGLRWARPHVSLADVRLETHFIAPYLRYNLVFFGSNLLFVLCQRGGEALVRAAGVDYAQVGYLSIAAAAYMAAAHGVWVVLMAFLPLLTRLRAQGRLDAAREWASRLLKLLSAGGVMICFAALLLGAEVVPLVVGPAFRPAGGLLLPISLAVLAHAVGSVGRLMALTLDRPRLALAAALAQASALVGLGLPLAFRFGAPGVAVAMAAAASLHALVFFWRVQKEAPLRLAPSLGVVALGVLFLPLAALPVHGPLSRIVLFLVFLAGYAAALRTTRLVTAEQLSALRRALRP